MRGGNWHQGFNCHLVLQLKASPSFCLALVLLEREVASSSQQSAGCSVSTKVTQRTCLPCSCVKTNQLIVHLLCKNSLKISQHPRRETLPAPNTPNRVKLPTLQVNQNPLKRDSQRSQGIENGRFSVHTALSDFAEQFSLVLSSVNSPICVLHPSALFLQGNLLLL